ncbi:MAG: HDOD domain-containing protein [Desulfotalea sp.]
MPNTQEFADIYSSLKPFPHTALELTKLINDPNSSINEFENVIQIDPILVGKVLELVNSSAFSPVEKIDSITRAISFIGTQGLHNLIIEDTIHDYFQEDESSPNEFSKKYLWKHSIATAIISKMVSERIFGIKGDKSYLCAILHDIGLIIENFINPDQFIKICFSCNTSTELVEKEEETFGTSHNKIGQIITQKWQMPMDVSLAIRDHHCHGENFAAPKSLTGIIQISEHLCNILGFQALPNLTHIAPPHITTHIEKNIDEYDALLQDLPAIINDVTSIYS